MQICMMLKILRKKWNVDGWPFFFILCTFGVTGTFTAWISKALSGWFHVDNYTMTWWLLKLIPLLIGYQIFLLMFGFCFGQFAFFWKFEKKLLTAMGILKKDNIEKIAIFASGSGSNAQKIIEAFAGSEQIRVEMVISNNANAGVLQIAERNNIDTRIIRKGEEDEMALLKHLKRKRINYIVLAGYLWKVPDAFIKSYPARIINIHPALLPKFGGKGMYGLRVHDAVIKAGEMESGITIHFVDEVYDNGEIIFQEKVQVQPSDTAESLSKKIQALEHKHFPEVIRSVIKAKSALKTGT